MTQTQIRDYEKLAKQILDLVGGEQNIVNVSRCTTRLRLVLKTITPEMKQSITQLTGVITVLEKGGQLQIVIGTHVNDVYDAFVQHIDINANKQSGQGSILNRVVTTMAAVFASFVYILAAAGILQGILIIINLINPSVSSTTTFQVFNFISWAPFYFLPIFIAITASKHFKTDVFIAVACCMALLSPTWTDLAKSIKEGSALTLFSLPLSETTYSSSVLPPLFLVWILSYLEQFLSKILPKIIQPLFLPLICLVLMVPLTLLVIGPLTSSLAHGVAQGYNALVDFAPYLAGMIIGAFWQVLVIFGVHWGITPMIMANFEAYQQDSFQAFQTIAVIGQVGAVLGVYIKSRQQEIKMRSLSAFLTGLFGITEPAIYGITLRFKKPFIYGCVAASVGCLAASFFNPMYYAYAGLPGPLTIINSISESDHYHAFYGVVIGSIISILLPIVLIQLFWHEPTSETAQNQDGINKHPDTLQPDATTAATSLIITSPAKGKVFPLSSVEDGVFSDNMLGDGVALLPDEETLYSPVNGAVKVLFDESKHAIGLLSNEGVEILIHVGIDTVNLKEGQFHYHVAQDQRVNRGDPLISFNRQAITQAGYSLITPIVITNSDTYQSIHITAQTDVQRGETLLTI